MGLVLSSFLRCSALLGLALAAFPDCTHGPLRKNAVCDTRKDALTRAQALVSLFTLDEMMNLTQHTSPGVPRLGIPAYNWWGEALHGYAHSPGNSFAASGPFSSATSFPAPITMGAAFDDPLIRQVASVISTEARAFNNHNFSGKIIDFWAPNINPFRDPRWGRGQETPGEDPFHLSSYVNEFIQGMQVGSDARYKKVVSTCKHFAAYDLENWNGNNRMAFDAIVSQQDMVEYFLPSFRMCARDADVGAVMCSYNSVNGIPACADSYLLETVLRDKWNWVAPEKGHWVTSDCDAVANIFDPHNFTADFVAASADALNAGTDLDCGTTYPQYLPAGAAQGLFSTATLARALTRLYTSLVTTGWFDPPAAQPYRQLAWADVDTPAAQALARTAAVEGLVLLKNDGTLPLSAKKTKKVALIGPWANATTQMQSNYNGNAPFLHGPLFAAEQMGLEVSYAFGTNISSTTTSGFAEAMSAASSADVVIFAGGIDDTIEAEGNDRMSIAWPGNQLDLVAQLAGLGKPLVVLQFGGGQVDDSALLVNDKVNSLLWAGYPGQDGGTAVFDVLFGKSAPAGRLPVTQYPASYVDAVPMTDMALRPTPGPGRTYKWYSSAVLPFGFGLHYTTFATSFSTKGSTHSIQTLLAGCKAAYLDLCPFSTVGVAVRNTGAVASDYVALLFLSGAFGPAPHPLKSLVAYARAHAVPVRGSRSVQLPLTLGSLARVDESGNTVLYPGTYRLGVDVDPKEFVEFTLTGKEAVLDEWPQSPHTA